MFENSEKIVNDAYNRMDLSKQAWNLIKKKKLNSYCISWTEKTSRR